MKTLGLSDDRLCSEIKDLTKLQTIKAHSLVNSYGTPYLQKTEIPRLSVVQLVLRRDFLAVYWPLALKLKTGRHLTENKKESEAHGDHVGSAISDNAMGTHHEPGNLAPVHAHAIRNVKSGSKTTMLFFSGSEGNAQPHITFIK